MSKTSSSKGAPSAGRPRSDSFRKTGKKPSEKSTNRKKADDKKKQQQMAADFKKEAKKKAIQKSKRIGHISII